MQTNPKNKVKMQFLLDYYLAMDEPRLKEAMEGYLKENPEKTVSWSTVQRWSAKYKWVDKALEKYPDMKTPGHLSGKHPQGTPLKARKAAARKTQYDEDLKLATPETIKALQGKILDKMHTELDMVHLDTTEKYADMLALVSKMQQLEHEFRGAKFVGNDEAVDGDDSADPPGSSPVVDFKRVATQVRHSKT